MIVVISRKKLRYAYIAHCYKRQRMYKALIGVAYISLLLSLRHAMS